MYNCYTGALVFLTLINICGKQGNCCCQPSKPLPCPCGQRARIYRCTEINPCCKEERPPCNRCGGGYPIEPTAYYARQYGYTGNEWGCGCGCEN